MPLAFTQEDFLVSRAVDILDFTMTLYLCDFQVRFCAIWTWMRCLSVIDIVSLKLGHILEIASFGESTRKVSLNFQG